MASNQTSAVVEALAYKHSENAKYGLLFHRNDHKSPLTIKEIRGNGIFGSSKIKPGMVVLEINGLESLWMSPSEAAKALWRADVDTVLSIKATEPFTVEATKAERDAKWGFAIKNSTSERGIFIRSVSENGPFANGRLRVGMMIIEINGRPCPQQVREVTQIIKDTESKMELVVVEHSQLEERDEMDMARSEDDLLDSRIVSEDLFTIFGRAREGREREQKREYVKFKIETGPEDVDLNNQCDSDTEKELSAIEQSMASIEKTSKQLKGTQAILATIRTFKGGRRKRTPSRHKVALANRHPVVLKRYKRLLRSEEYTSTEKRVERLSEQSPTTDPHAELSDKPERKWFRGNSKKKDLNETATDDDEWVDLDEEVLTACSDDENARSPNILPTNDRSAYGTMKLRKMPTVGNHSSFRKVIGTPFSDVGLASDPEEDREPEINSWMKKKMPWISALKDKSMEKQPTRSISAKQASESEREQKGSKLVETASTMKQGIIVNKNTAKGVSKEKETVEKGYRTKRESEEKADARCKHTRKNKKRAPLSRTSHGDSSLTALLIVKKWHENVFRAICSCPIDTTIQERSIPDQQQEEMEEGMVKRSQYWVSDGKNACKESFESEDVLV